MVQSASSNKTFQVRKWPPYLENLCQLNLLVVKDCMDTVNSLLGLVRRSPLGFLMQDGNQSPDGHVTNDIRRQIKALSRRCGKL